MQESQETESRHVWKRVPEALLAACDAHIPKDTRGQLDDTWQARTRHNVLILMTCGCLQVKRFKAAKKGTGMCCACAGALSGSRGEERAALQKLKQVIRSHSHAWYLLREFCMRDDNEQLSKVDCMLISARVESLSAAEHASAKLAVELDGTSHRCKPFEYGKDRVEAMEEQHERDSCKDAELRRQRIASVRISSSPDDWKKLLSLMNNVGGTSR